MGPIFDNFGDEAEDLEESGPEMEISSRDLGFGGYGMGRKKKGMIQKMGRRLKTDFSNGRTSFGATNKVS